VRWYGDPRWVWDGGRFDSVNGENRGGGREAGGAYGVGGEDKGSGVVDGLAGDVRVRSPLLGWTGDG